jgi:hypothetical protein
LKIDDLGSLYSYASLGQSASAFARAGDSALFVLCISAALVILTLSSRFIRALDYYHPFKRLSEDKSASAEEITLSRLLPEYFSTN